MRKTYIKKLRDDVQKGSGKSSVTQLSRKIGLSYSQLYRIVKGISAGTISSWEKIARYYQQQ